MKFMPLMLVNVFCSLASIACGYDTIAILGVLLTILMVLLYILYAVSELRLDLIRFKHENDKPRGWTRE